MLPLFQNNLHTINIISTAEPQRTGNLTRGVGVRFSRYVTHTSSGIHGSCSQEGCCYTPPYHPSPYCSGNNHPFGWMAFISTSSLPAHCCSTWHRKPQPPLRWSNNWCAHAECGELLGKGQEENKAYEGLPCHWNSILPWWIHVERKIW